MAIIDHKAIYKQRLLQQYKSSTNLIALIDALIEGQGDLEIVLDDLLTKRGIDTAVGQQLDIIGEIVGQPRAVVDLAGSVFFAYQGAAGLIDGYGSVLDGTLGARYLSEGETTGDFRELSDFEYRFFIKSKICKNTKMITIEDVIDCIRFMLGEDTVVVIDETGNASAALTLFINIPTSTAQILSANDVFPRPAGVRYDVTLVAAGGTVFAFNGFSGGSTFGTATNPSVGGVFAS